MKMNLTVARETAWKLGFKGKCRSSKICIDGYFNHVTVRRVTSNRSMPNQHAPDKESLSFYIPRTLAARLRKKAKQRDESISEFLTALFTNATNDIELTPEDYREIAEAVERAKRKRLGANKLPRADRAKEKT